MKKITLCGAILAFVLVPVLANAGPIIRSGETISVDASQVLGGDFYGFGGIITVSGEAKEDAYLAGGTVTVNAPVAGDLVVVGGAVQVHGPVSDDVRVIGGDVTIAESVKGDVIVVGGLLSVLSTATVEGDVIFLGGELAVEGDIIGSVHGTADKARINAQVGGDVTVTAASLLTLGDNADISGDVIYESRNDLVRAQDARVGGDVQRRDAVPEVKDGLLQTYVLAVIIILFAALSLYFINRGRLTTFVENASVNLGMTGLIGLGMLLVLPFIGSMLFVSVIGSVVGLIVFTGYIFALALALALSGPVVGYGVQKFFFKKNSVTLSSISFGTILFCLFGLIPFIGGLLMLACFVVALGGLGMALYRGIRG